ncbi:MAG: hypothetical protein CMA88_01650 [Euryarchaeota archaeon]|nr:hypothetical protein [Euryarchaeota archaeon]|tara:strand:+ start:3926 stop:4588 length:663 start_codon:yes stop_codon:yes gene_type:complete
MGEFSEIEEMYLKRIFEIHSDTPEAIVKTTQLAEVMKISPASVTEMIQRLSERDMVTHIPYRGCRLTPQGFQLAARVKRREGLLEILLRDVIGFSGDVKEVACKMEHAVGADLEATLDRLLGYPEMTSDGSRIPSVDRSFETLGIGTLLPLSSLPDGASASVEMIVSRGDERITIRDAGVEPGSIITNTGGSFSCEQKQIELSSHMSIRILARVTGLGAE